MIRNSLRTWVKHKFWHPLVNRRGVIKYFEEKLYFPKHSLSFEYTFKNGIYEQDNLHFIIDLTREGSYYIDIGANVGLMSIPILKRFEKVQVISVEANESTFNFLKKTHEQCSAKERWRLIHSAASDASGQDVELHVSSEDKSAFASIKDTNRVRFTEVRTVKTITIDELWQNGENFDISFIKIDIEGADLLALKGGGECIRKCRPGIMIEWNQINIRPFGFGNNHLIDWMNEFHYDCYAIPSLNKIQTASDLRLNCLFTESFLLIPVGG